MRWKIVIDILMSDIFDYEKSAALVFAERMAMMGTCIFAGYDVQKGILKIEKEKKRHE